MATSGVCVRASGNVTVLFVDDDEDTLFAYRTLAASEGMTAEVARCGHEALALADIILPDVIVLDIGLRGPDDLNGLEVSRRLRASLRTRAIPVVIVSGYSGERDEAEVRASGCEGYLVKPCSADELFGLVARLAADRREQAAASGTAAG